MKKCFLSGLNMWHSNGNIFIEIGKIKGTRCLCAVARRRLSRDTDLVRKNIGLTDARTGLQLCASCRAIANQEGQIFSV